ncbi:hypothetical protein ACQ4PT_025461 [Festuca glaucescens]
MVVPPLAGVVNCGVWLAYGLAVKDKNISVVVVNSTGVAFNLVYTIIFILKSGTRRLYKLGAVLVAFALAAAIVAMDRNLFISKWGWDLPSAIGMSGAITGSFMYSFGAMVSMVSAGCNLNPNV